MERTPPPVATWHRQVAQKRLTGIDQWLAEDAVFQSPAVHTPQVGRAIVAKYLAAALVVLDDPSFRYGEAWYGENSAVLEFEATIDGVFINGVDIIHWNADGRIVSFKVMIRPLKALQVIIPLMGRQLQAASVE